MDRHEAYLKLLEERYYNDAYDENGHERYYASGIMYDWLQEAWEWDAEEGMYEFLLKNPQATLAEAKAHMTDVGIRMYAKTMSEEEIREYEMEECGYTEFQQRLQRFYMKQWNYKMPKSVREMLYICMLAPEAHGCEDEVMEYFLNHQNLSLEEFYEHLDGILAEGWQEGYEPMDRLFWPDMSDGKYYGE